MDDRLCILVMIGSDETGRKELLALSDGYRESEASWTEVLVDLKQRGLKDSPKLAIGDGALVLESRCQMLVPDRSATLPGA
jgi:putative transposase